MIRERQSRITEIKSLALYHLEIVQEAVAGLAREMKEEPFDIIEYNERRIKKGLKNLYFLINDISCDPFIDIIGWESSDE